MPIIITSMAMFATYRVVEGGSGGVVEGGTNYFVDETCELVF